MGPPAVGATGHGAPGVDGGGWAAARLEEMARFAIAAEYLLCENVATIHEPDGHNSHLHIEQLGKTLTTLAAVYADDEENDDEENGDEEKSLSRTGPR